MDSFDFDTTDSLNEINAVIHQELNKLLNKFVNNYKLYEETYKGVLNLQAVKQALNGDVHPKVLTNDSVKAFFGGSKTSTIMDTNLQNEMVRLQIQSENKYEKIIQEKDCVISNLQKEICMLRDTVARLDVCLMKYFSSKNIVDLTVEVKQEKQQDMKENIKLEIHEEE
jgi:hypothetical protein